jgi:hypothetical protein
MAKRARRLFIFPDRHFGMDIGNPVVDALSECVLRSIEYFEPDETIGLGDLLECAAFSRHPPNSAEKMKARGFVEDEVDPARQFLDRVQAATREKTHLILGNHEFRAERWCVDHGLSGSDAQLLMPSRLLMRTSDDQPRKKISLTPYSDDAPFYLWAPNALACHGISYAQNAAVLHLQRFRSYSVVFGHCHTAHYKALRNPITNREDEAWCDGCISSRTPGYKAHDPSVWTWGASGVYVSRERPDDWTRAPIRYRQIDDTIRCIMPDGKAISVKIKR